MKKLLFLSLLISCFQVNAQNRQTVSIAFGPAWVKRLTGTIDGGARYETKLGWGAGIDASFNLATSWDLKVGFRYQELNSVSKVGNLMWASEYSTGTYVYDPSLPHSIELEIRDRAWQYMLGIRYYFNQPGTWQWYGDVETGVSYYGSRPKQAGNTTFLLVGGLGLGLQWLPSARQFGLFVQPVARYLVSPNRDSGFRGYGAIIPSLEIGLRSQLFIGG